MDLKSTHSSPVLADSAPMNNSRLGLHSALLPYSTNSSSFSSSFVLNVPRRRAGTLDDVRATLLDSMIASSPTNNILPRELSSESTLGDVHLAYLNWMLKYPSALASFEQIDNRAKGKRIALFLDYDGTLSPIVDNPDEAFMSNAMRATVQNVAKHFPTAIISGRSRDKVYEFVGLSELYYAGSHGMDIMCPVQADSTSHKGCIRSTDMQGKEVNLFQPAREFVPLINEVYNSLAEVMKNIPGTKVENNKFCVSVHYRNVNQDKWDTVGQHVQDILNQYPRLRLTHGRKVLEIRPVLSWDKGKAVEFLLESLGLANCDDVLPIYVGDDRTDEDAFKVLREGNRGFGILVCSAPKESNAFYSLRDPSEVMEFLKMLVMWKEKSGNNNTP